MSEVVEIESPVYSVVIEQPVPESSVLVEVVEGQVVDVDGELVGSAGVDVELYDRAPSSVEVVQGPALEVVEVEGQRGLPGPEGPPGAPGENPEDIPDMTLIFENGLI
jgi:hypothetical protein